MKILRAFAFLLATIAIYLGVPLVGWGAADTTGFFSNAARAAYAGAILLFGVAIGIQAITQPEAFRGGKEEIGKRVPRQHAVRLVMVGALYLGLFSLSFADRQGLLVMADASMVRWAGVVLAALGCGMVFWSGVSLGKQYSQEVTLQEGHRLITHGAFGFVRHPRYLGVALLAVGLSLLFRSWPGLAISPLILGILLFRIHDEEKLMQQAFGQEWQDYARRTRRLIPFVY
jgi:protein-S-isoprenylcysteine O-methyltransferase Ste14